MGFSANLKRYRDASGLTQEQLALAAGWSGQSRVANYEAGTRTPSLEHVEALARALRITRPELLGDAVENGFSTVQALAAAVGLSDGEEANDYATTHGLKFRTDSLRKKGLLGADLAVLYGKGDSMAPVIETGDAVLFNKDDREQIRHEGLYVVQLPGTNHHDLITVKQAELIGDIVTFRALNPQGDHHWRKPRLKNDPRNPIAVVGKVCWVGKWL